MIDWDLVSRLCPGRLSDLQAFVNDHLRRFYLGRNLAHLLAIEDQLS
jgi:hypothetical protein